MTYKFLAGAALWIFILGLVTYSVVVFSLMFSFLPVDWYAIIFLWGLYTGIIGYWAGRGR